MVVAELCSCTSPLRVLPVAAACKHCLVTPKGECGRPSRVINEEEEGGEGDGLITLRNNIVVAAIAFPGETRPGSLLLSPFLLLLSTNVTQFALFHLSCIASSLLVCKCHRVNC